MTTTTKTQTDGTQDALVAFTIAFPGKPRLTWYFDLPEQAQEARKIAEAHGAEVGSDQHINVLPAEELVTAADEVRSWLEEDC